MGMVGLEARAHSWGAPHMSLPTRRCRLTSVEGDSPLSAAAGLKAGTTADTAVATALSSGTTCFLSFGTPSHSPEEGVQQAMTTPLVIQVLA